MKLHPAIDPDYPAGVSAFRQLAIGAKPAFCRMNGLKGA